MTERNERGVQKRKALPLMPLTELFTIVQTVEFVDFSTEQGMVLTSLVLSATPQTLFRDAFEQFQCVFYWTMAHPCSSLTMVVSRSALTMSRSRP